MAQEEAAGIEPQEEVPQVSQLLVKEASQELSAVLYEYAETCWEMQELEARLAEARRKRALMLKERPWLGNVQGILNKEAFKMAKAAAVPAAEVAVHSDQMEMDNPALEQKAMVELIPKKAKPAPRPIRKDKTPEAVRASILKKSNKLEERASSSKKQFLPEHPSHQ